MENHQIKYQDSKKRFTRFEYVQIADRLSKQNNGLLPNFSWLKDNGYHNLLVMMRKYPEMFSHVKRHRITPDMLRGREKNKIRDSYLYIAEQLSRNKDIVPTREQIIKSGHGKLLSYMQKHPRLFDRFPISKNIKRQYMTLEDHLKHAEEIVKNNNGVLPPTMEIINKHGFALYKCIRRHPDKFAHLQDTNGLYHTKKV